MCEIVIELIVLERASMFIHLFLAVRIWVVSYDFVIIILLHELPFSSRNRVKVSGYPG